MIYENGGTIILFLKLQVPMYLLSEDYGRKSTV